MSRINKSEKISYLDQVFGSEDSLLKKIKALAKEEGVNRMQISSHEGRILQFLTRLSKAKKVVEIGTLYAYSTLHIAQALPEEGKIFTLDRASNRHEKSSKILKDWAGFQKIEWICGEALESLKSIESFGPFDMLFIDADKGAYLEYLNWAEKNLKSGALLIADNTFLFGAVYGEPQRSQQEETVEIMRKFNQRLADSSIWTGALIPTEEGMTVSLKS